MKTLVNQLGRCGFALAAIIVSACADQGPLTPLGGDQAVQTQPVGIVPAGSTGLPRVLIDASRDGGVWWYPQAGPFSGSANHQGKAFTDSARAAGYEVDELPRAVTITADLLQPYGLVIRAGNFGRYTPNEITAYADYVRGGGTLLLLGDHMTYAPPDSLALAFGIQFAGVTRGNNLLNTFATHPITAGVSAFLYQVGAGIIASPASATIVGRLSSDSYLDLDFDGVQGPADIAAPAVLGVMSAGSGRIVFCGDTNLWQNVPRPLLRNVLAWLKG